MNRRLSNQLEKLLLWSIFIHTYCTFDYEPRTDFVERKHQLYVQYVSVCNWESVHTYTCCMCMAVCMSSCVAYVLYLPHYSRSPVLSVGCEQYLATHSSPHPCPLMVSSVTAHNGGWILWPTTPTWHIYKSLTVTSDNRWRGKSVTEVWLTHMLLPNVRIIGGLPNGETDTQFCYCFDAWKTISVLFAREYGDSHVKSQSQCMFYLSTSLLTVHVCMGFISLIQTHQQ